MIEHIRKTWRRLTPFGRLLAFLVVAALAIGLPVWIARAVDGDADWATHEVAK